jgi:hypothetical protein
MSELPEEMLLAGVSVDVLFPKKGPSFGDLLLLCGRKHPRFPPTKSLHFETLEDLQFDQVDDYFGVRAIGGEGDDVAIWLYPLVAGETVHHHPGPFEGIRLTYNVLRNPERRAEHYLFCGARLAALAERISYRGDELPADRVHEQLGEDIAAIVKHWAAKGIPVGSEEALEIDF